MSGVCFPVNVQLSKQVKELLEKSEKGKGKG